jgi:acyl dehydratase
MAFDFSAVGKTFGPHSYTYDWQRTALYALGCGAGTDELDLLIESRGPKVLPTFSVVPAFAPLIESLGNLGGNMLTLVHGAQKCVIHAPLPPEATLKTTAKVTGLYDKGKGALAFIATESQDEKGKLLFETEWQIFFRGEGGFGGEKGPETPPYEAPAGMTPTASFEMPTQPTQALLYRLGGSDLNPIHSDPEIAGKAGFERPILHGLATYGHAARAAIKGLMNGDSDRLLSIEGRFSKPVYPGDTIMTDLFAIKPGELYFVTWVKERKEPVITLGRVTYKT